MYRYVFNIQKFYVLFREFMCFEWIWEQKAIISLYSINWLVFVIETDCVHCAVRTGSLNIIQIMCFIMDLRAKSDDFSIQR